MRESERMTTSANQNPYAKPGLIPSLRVVLLFQILKMGLEVKSSFHVAVSRVEFRPAQFLQVGRLGMNEQLVHNRDFNILDQAEIDAHPHL